jgi:acyl-CoA reductase-like NAD-dependent aldehyde dehydrogenase
LKGIQKELQKREKPYASRIQKSIIAARAAQGREDWQASTQEERQDVIDRWHCIQMEIREGSIISDIDLATWRRHIKKALLL